jgi:hypothetical protein
MTILSPAETASWLSKNSELVLSGLQEALLAFLQSDGIKFRTVMGDESKTDTRKLLPCVQDRKDKKVWPNCECVW